MPLNHEDTKLHQKLIFSQSYWWILEI